TPTKHTVDISTTLVRHRNTSTHKKPTTSQSSQDDSQAQARREEQTAFNNTMNNLNHRLSSSTTVTMPRPGGEAYENYAQAVKSIYQREWNAPDQMVDNDGVAKASIVIQRDGNVLSAHIIHSSGNPTVDRSVERVLERVKVIAPFPEGATDNERTFTIS